MSDENSLDTDVTAQDQTDQETDSNGDQANDQNQKPFSEEQEQYIGSWLGRIVAKQLEPIKEQMGTLAAAEPTVPETTDARTKFNELLQSQIFEGDPMGAIDRALEVREAARENLAKSQQIQVDKKITEYSEEPFYKDIFPDMKIIAHELLAQGVPPDYAASHAFQKAKASHLEKLTMSADTANFDVLPTGKRVKTKTPKLPQEFKAAFERDRAAGLFKDEAEYIANLSPQIRKQYSI